MIDFSCDKCGKQYSLKPEFAGRTTTCSGCKQPLLVPPQSPTPEAAARIAFSCMKCGMKFDVAEEFAGRKTTCPTCKIALVVPSLELATVALPAAGKIDGLASSLARAKVDAEVTLAGSFVADNTALNPLATGTSSDGTRYRIESELARGGMGAVLRAIDCDIRREVAVKYLLDQSNTKNKVRFVEEAQITGQLEHPNIVPIHELGVDAQQRIFFTMKMVKGRSLAQIINLLRDDPVASDVAYPLNRLLNIFVNVCNALAYAHSRGVVHRDLKPANIMVGDFGEVYVMDWGLAKVLDRAELQEIAAPLAFSVDEPPAMPTATLADESGSGNVVTSRDSTADLTQVGAIMGTPVYMPPEQAAGRTDEIDERSDIYSLGAILYEILTLHPPIDKAGGFWPIVMRVGQGQIAPPAQKAPDRAKAGRIPVELSAIAMKALAKEKSARYQSVERLQRDIQLFQEGRSVSAKQDTNWEIFSKLVRRNKGASAGAALAIVVLLASLFFIASAWHSTGEAYNAYRDEQEGRRQALKKSVPAFLAAADLAIEKKQFDQSLIQLDTVLSIDAKNTRALLRKGQVLIAQRKFIPARDWLTKYVKAVPSDSDAKELAGLCDGADAPESEAAIAAAFGQVFNRQKQFVLAESMFQDREKLVQFYRQRLDSGWQGLGQYLTVDRQGQLEIVLMGKRGFTKKSLNALAGVPINHLKIISIPELTDLTPIQKLPLVSLDINGADITDLTPLKSMALKDVRLSNCRQLRDLSPLAGMKLDRVDLAHNSLLQSLAALEGMPLTHLDLDSGAVFKGVQSLKFVKGMPLKHLKIRQGAVVDLSPLKGMPLEYLELGTFGVLNIEPLRGMPLRVLSLINSNVKEFSPLENAPLERLRISAFTASSAANLDVLRRLDTLVEVYIPTIGALSPEEFFRKYGDKKSK